MLRRCGIEFGVLGADETCCGDPARVLGYERLFQETARAQEAGADTIVTGCAYCRQMLDDSVKATNLDDDLKVVDIVSLVLKSLPPDPNAASRPRPGASAHDVGTEGASDADDPSASAPRVCG